MPGVASPLRNHVCFSLSLPCTLCGETAMARFQANEGRSFRVVALLVALILFICLYQQSSHDRTDRTSSFSRRDDVKNHTSNVRDIYDYIIIGGGQSGLAVANRLSEGGKATVLVVEFGYLYRDDPLIAHALGSPSIPAIICSMIPS